MSLSEDSKEARCCSSEYDKARKSVLRMYKWGWASNRKTLSPDPVTPDFEFEYRFTLPSDYIKVIELFDYDGEYRIEGNYLLCNTDTVHLKYVSDSVDISRADPLFSDALEWYLAWNISRYLTESETVRQEAWSGFRNIFSQAKFHQSTEHSQEVNADYDLVDARHGRGFVRDPGTN